MEELNRKTVDEFRSSQKIPIVVVLDNVRSMHNVGSIFRTADAFLLEAIYLCGYTPRPPHRDIHKTALGATDSVEWKYFPNTREAVSQLKDSGYNIWASEQASGSIALDRVALGEMAEIKSKDFIGSEIEIRDNAISLEKPMNGSNGMIGLGKKLAIIFGNEVEGVDEEVLKLCDGCLEIPQLGVKHSLNISVAAGIVLWHLFHQFTIRNI